MKVWRLLPFLNADGQTQMAIDAAIFEGHRLGESPPTLRFYQWQRPTLSLGYHQRQIPEHWRSIQVNGRPIELVQRPTGGRGVLHAGDLTYAVIWSSFADSRSIAYAEICKFLITGWGKLGIRLQYGTTGRGYIHNPNCFGTATRADLVLENDSKLIGSAQKRSGSVILQHGSMALSPDRNLWESIFQEPAPEIPEAIQTIDRTTLIQTLTQAAIEAFQLDAIEVHSLNSFEENWVNHARKDH